MDRFEEILQRMEEAYEQESGCSVEAVSEVGLRIRVCWPGSSIDWTLHWIGWKDKPSPKQRKESSWIFTVPKGA